MKIPAYTNMKIVDDNGYLTEPWAQLFMILLQQMQLNLSDQGFVIPSQTSANIARINAADSTRNGTVIYNSSTNKLQVRLSDGSFHDIVTL